MDIVINLTLSAKASRKSSAGLFCCPYNIRLLSVSTYAWVRGELIFAWWPRCRLQDPHATVGADVTLFDQKAETDPHIPDMGQVGKCLKNDLRGCLLCVPGPVIVLGESSPLAQVSAKSP